MYAVTFFFIYLLPYELNWKYKLTYKNKMIFKFNLPQCFYTFTFYEFLKPLPPLNG